MMHCFEVKALGGSSRFRLTDGLWGLPGSTDALVIVGDQVILVGPGGRRRLRRGVSVPAGYGEVIWLRGMTTLATLDGEPTLPDELSPRLPGLALWPSGNGSPIPIDRGIVLLGRDPLCDLRLEGASISRFHVALAPTPRGVRLMDLGSKNGTRVDGRWIRDVAVTGEVFIGVGRSRVRLAPREASDGWIDLPSAALSDVHRWVERAAPSPAPVVLVGETGSGKEGIARRIHERSGRGGPFVTLNAAVLRGEFAATELFGHVEGAYTGAVRSRRGAFLAADGGTLFLDEVGELALDVQADLLRVLEERRVRPLGQVESLPVDTRLVVATHRDLGAAVAAGRFREDLFHRLWVLPVEIPPLRSRPEDIDALCRGFLRTQPNPRTLSRAARAKLHRHRWPGNVRELLNVLRRACVNTDRRELQARDIRFNLSSSTCDTRHATDVIGSFVENAYQQTGGNVAAVARELGLRRSTVESFLRRRRRMQG